MTPATHRWLSVAGLAPAAVLLGIGLHANRLFEDATGEAGWTAYAPGHLPPEVRHPGPFGYYAGRWWILAGVLLGVLVLVTWMRRRPPAERAGPAAGRRPDRPPWRLPRPPSRVIPALAIAAGFIAVGLYADHHRPHTGICTVLRRRGSLDEAPPGLRSLCAEPPALLGHDAGRWWILSGLVVILLLLAATARRREPPAVGISR